MFSNILLGAAGFPTADLGDTVSQSARFYGTQRLTRTFSNNSGNTWTWSAWLKKTSNATRDQIIFGTVSPLQFTMARSNNFGWTQATVASFESALRRDPSAWYHRVDVSDGTDIKMYINGALVLTWAQASTGVNTNVEHFLGGDFANRSSEMWDGYIGQVYFIDGTAIGDTGGVIDEFGRYNEDGVWVPKNYTGTYGTNGFHLTLDSSQTNGIGHDSSGNGNDFTATGFDTAAISSSNTDNDIDYLDTPTNNYATLNPLLGRSASLNFEHANLRVQYGAGGARAGMVGFGIPPSSGKWYWEITLKEQKEGDVGIVSDGYDLENGNQSYGIDSTAQGWSWDFNEGRRDNFGNGTNPSGNETPSSHVPIQVGDTIGFKLDTDAGTCSIEINGVDQVQGATIGGTTLTNGSEWANIPTDRTIFPYFRLGGASGDANLDWNFGQMPFLYEPTGYQHVATNNLPEPTIKNGKEHFDVVTWTGNATAPRDISGLDFQPDLVWVKSRNAGHDHQLVDSVRGATRALRANETNSEDTWTDGLSDFNVDGFELNDDGTNARYNANGTNYVAWCWKAGGTAVSNTDGTITSSVSANTDAGFSIVSYTGNLTAGATVGHGLSSAPECIFVKSRDSAANWEVKHVGLSSNDHMLKLNATDAEEDLNGWNNTAPTNTVFSLGAANGTNRSGDDFIAYCWHSVAGYSKFGTYTGNGNSDGSFIYTGFRPAFVMIKCSTAGTSGVHNWWINDTTRAPFNPATNPLAANTNDQEANFSSAIYDINSNGFKLRGGSDQMNGNQTYIYCAFAGHPFGGENQPPATAR